MGKKKIIALVLVVVALALGISNLVMIQQKDSRISELNDKLSAEIAARKAIPESFNDQEAVGDDYQAVFLNGGQVYFGHIATIDEKHVVLGDIYYLRTDGAGDQLQNTSGKAAADVSLAKLGCELHGPEDRMVINRDHVSFWENLKVDSQVSKAIAEYVKANPNGEKCPV